MMRKILLVEDEDMLRDTAEIILSTQPYISHIAHHGQDALDKCSRETYDLILLDLMMPVMNGVEFLEHFMPTAPPHTKVLILSNLSSGKDFDRAMELGASGSILKTELTPKKMISLIRYELEASSV